MKEAKAQEVELASSTEWLDAIKLAEKEFKPFTTKGDKIVKRYRDDRSQNSTGKKYNILWSNIRTLFPAIYSRKPKAQCDRRFKDKDPIGRTAAQIIERALQYEIDHYSDYDSSIKNALMDRLLPGRGISWVRYEPTYAEEEATGEESQLSDDQDEVKEIQHETSPCDYVYWKDFLHSVARTWEEVTWVARRVYLERDEGVRRFGDMFKDVPLSHVPTGLEDSPKEAQDKVKKAVVWEIWCKKTGTAKWVAEGYQYILDDKPDPLQLENFFPCPKPLYATLTTDSLIPIADFLQYQDQANEIDELTDRISKLCEACKVVGVYDASQPAIERMLKEGVDNTLIPVSSWAAFGEKGGLKGSVDWLPLDMVVNALNQLYIAREQCKTVIYEITGLSDIIRGATKEAETATAQRLKSQFASLRLKELQNNLAIFASDLLRIKAQIMCNFYQPETLAKMSGIMNTEDAQYAMQAIQLLKDQSLRDFSIEVASDSLVELDQEAEQAARMQMLQAVGGFLKEAIQAPPTLAPLLGEMLLFGVRGFKVGRDIENAFEEAMQQLRQPQPPKPDPEQMKLQAQTQLEQMKMQATQQLEQFKAQLSVQTEQMKQEAQAKENLHQQELQAARDQQQAELNASLEAQKLDFERWKVELVESNKVLLAELAANTSLKQSSMTINAGKEQEGLTELDESGNEQPTSALSGLVEAINSNVANLMQITTQQQQDMAMKHAEMVAMVTKPKKVIRDANGRVAGVE